jgi:hypothetical protein
MRRRWTYELSLGASWAPVMTRSGAKISFRTGLTYRLAMAYSKSYVNYVNYIYVNQDNYI